LRLGIIDMSGRTLTEWLEYIERIHPKSIQLGLDRVREVREALDSRIAAPIFVVGGTNGKGSTCAMLEAIALAAGYRVGLYTSPHLVHYNERVRIDGKPVDDASLCAAFAAVESARAACGILLTYFEFGTLAAWELFARAALDVVILEVGLGGRLDAVNVFDADCAVLTGVALDHMDYLGSTREEIGAEKAGIFRLGKPAVVADSEPPRTVIEAANRIGADLHLIGRDFGYAGERGQWSFWGRRGRRAGLAYPALRGAVQLVNASAALAALDTLHERLPIGAQDVRNGLATVQLPARFQVLAGRPTVILDVAHNPQAATVLAANLSDMGFFPETYAVVGMLRDKDMAGVCAALKGRISAWFVASLSGPRAASSAQLAEAIAAVHAGGEIFTFDSPRKAFAAARGQANENDRIAVFGSFYTVAEVMAEYAATPDADPGPRRVG
jgi:dihydrofolate synthase/folylpolyglutamate synthase